MPHTSRLYRCSGLGVTGSTISETRDRFTGHDSAGFLLFSLFLHVRDETKRNETGTDRRSPYGLLCSWPRMMLHQKAIPRTTTTSFILTPASFLSCVLFCLCPEHGAGVWRVTVSTVRATSSCDPVLFRHSPCQTTTMWGSVLRLVLVRLAR